MNFITISPHPRGKHKVPLEDLLEYDIVLNVSDHLDLELTDRLGQEGIQSYWLPFGESFGMPLENEFGAMFILWRAEEKGQKVLLLCMAGMNRSAMIRDCYRLMMTGEYEEESALMLNIKDSL